MGAAHTRKAHRTTMVIKMKLPQKRNDFAPYLVSLGLTGNAVEIGVAEGGFSFYLLDRWPGTCYQVDPWLHLTEGIYRDYCNQDTTEQERRFKLVMDKSVLYKGRSRVMRMFSDAAAVLFPDNFFDFVYIDANHKLEFIRKDIALWWPKVKVGGIFAGHDYLDGVIQSGDYGVKTAVNEFVQMNNLGPVLAVTGEKDYPSWWVRKS